MPDLEQELTIYTCILSSALKDIAINDCFIVLYSDFIYKNIISESTEYVHSLYPSIPTLNITFVSFSKRKYAKKIKNELIELIHSISSTFKVVVHISWTGGIKEKDYNYLETTRIGAYIVKFINEKVSIVHNTGSSTTE